MAAESTPQHQEIIAGNAGTWENSDYQGGCPLDPDPSSRSQEPLPSSTECLRFSVDFRLDSCGQRR